MVNRSKRLGTSWESEIVRFLQDHGWIHAERRALAGSLDKGDIAGVVGLCIEAKNTARMELGQWVKEAQAEAVNAKARLGVVWAKRRGKASAADGYVIMTGAQFAALLKEAGY